MTCRRLCSSGSTTSRCSSRSGPSPSGSRLLVSILDQDLLGLYEGINRLERGGGYHLATPDRITLFWRPIVEEVGTGGPDALRREVRKTIVHEVAHHFGIDDAELERLGG